jgi:hypothetical protein
MGNYKNIKDYNEHDLSDRLTEIDQAFGVSSEKDILNAINAKADIIAELLLLIRRNLHGY